MGKCPINLNQENVSVTFLEVMDNYNIVLNFLASGFAVVASAYARNGTLGVFAKGEYVDTENSEISLNKTITPKFRSWHLNDKEPSYTRGIALFKNGVDVPFSAIVQRTESIREYDIILFEKSN